MHDYTNLCISIKSVKIQPDPLSGFEKNWKKTAKILWFMHKILHNWYDRDTIFQCLWLLQNFFCVSKLFYAKKHIIFSMFLEKVHHTSRRTCKQSRIINLIIENDLIHSKFFHLKCVLHFWHSWHLCGFFVQNLWHFNLDQPQKS